MGLSGEDRSGRLRKEWLCFVNSVVGSSAVVGLIVAALAGVSLLQTVIFPPFLMVAEKRFRKLNAPHLMTDVYAGERYEDGSPVEQRKKIAA